MSTSHPGRVSVRIRRSTEMSRNCPLSNRDISIRLTESHAPGDSNLGQVLRDDDRLNARDQFSLEQMGVGIGEAKFSQKWW